MDMSSTVELHDADVLSIDESTGNIVVNKIFDNIEKGNSINIHFTEDSDMIQHEYVVSFIDPTDNVTYLDWITMNDKTLNEANPFKAIKDKISPDQATQLAKSHKVAAKADKKLNKKATDLYRRDIEHGKNWDFYLQLNDGSHIKKPLKYNDVMDMYRSNNLKPWIVNAVVVADGFIVRRGKQDLDETGTRYSSTTGDVLPAYEQKWTEEDVKEFKELLKKSKTLHDIVALSLPKKDSKKASKQTDKTEKSIESDSSNKTVKGSKGITDNLLAKFKDLSKVAGLAVLDDNMKRVNNLDVITPNTVSDYWVMINNKETPLNQWLLTAIKSTVLTEDCDVSSINVNDILLESPQIRLSDNDLVDPAKVDFKELGRAAVERENQAKQATIEMRKREELRTKYFEAPEKLDAAVNSNMLVTDTLEVLHDILVPSQGVADSAAGELVRAMMRILYRDSNDGDKFFEGYGIETCGSSAEYLFDNGFSEDIQNILEHAWQLSDDDDKYTDALYNLTDKVIKHIKDNPELFFTPNEKDSRDYSNTYISENQPRYEFELYGSDDINTLVDKGVLTSWDLTKYVEGQLEWESEYRDAEVANPWSHHDTSVTVVNLTRDGYDRLKDAFEHNPEKWWEDLTSEYADDLSDSDYDDDYEEE